ncbi:nose resistant to fluoxetine protein 6 [Plutella xylostella]|uniref:nose resistant to fluoxetine protein 6 n=1 Tax=Plutella xylostella TaxID=51655 RepID=UPI002032A7C5|nr:nose resistant to fluoxetine protein 6 [Plutella xylostella]
MEMSVSLSRSTDLQSVSGNMRNILLLVLFIVLSVAQSSVIPNETKPVQEDVTVTTENGTVKNYSEKDTKSKHDAKAISAESRVYLEDVFHNLKNQNWTKDEEPCLNQTLKLLKGLQNFSLWAVWEWDSIASEPVGLLAGNLYQLGNFDECLDTPWRTTHPELRMQYCLASIQLERTDSAVKRKLNEPFDPYSSALDYIQDRPHHLRPLTEITWGICVPQSCSGRAISRLLAVTLARSHLGTAGMRPRIHVKQDLCQNEEVRPFDRGFYSFVIVAVVLTIIALVCTYLNCGKDKAESIKGRMIEAFCIRANAKDLMRMKKEGIEVLYGIRFLTICFIVLDHKFGMSGALALSNGRQVDTDAISSVLGMLLVHDDLFVDTFFMLSGFLAAMNMMMFRRFPNPIVLIVKRYIRLVVALAVVVYYTAVVLPYLGSGPLWPLAVRNESDMCRKNWWLNLLMLSNYIDVENTCLVVTWYIPCDFHLFVVSVFLVWLYRNGLPKISITLSTVVAVASIIVPGAIVYAYNLPGVQLFTYEFIRDPRSSLQFAATYVKTHTRASAYVVGFISGCVFAHYRHTGNLKRIYQPWSSIGAVSSLVLMLVVLLSGSAFLSRDVSAAAAAAYAAVNRPVWAAGVAALVLCCALGHVPLIKSFLSWYPWVPLSRLAYGIYLIHSVLITRTIFTSRDAMSFDYFEMFAQSWSLIFVSGVIALLIWLLAEGPANNLVMIIINPRRFNRDGEAETSSDASAPHKEPAPGPAGTPAPAGHLADNLPSSISFHSKF